MGNGEPVGGCVFTALRGLDVCLSIDVASADFGTMSSCVDSLGSCLILLSDGVEALVMRI